MTILQKVLFGTAVAIGAVTITNLFFFPNKWKAALMSIFNSPVGYYLIRLFKSQKKQLSKRDPMISGHLEIRIVPTLEDNYTYLIIDREQKTVIAIDPGLNILDELEPFTLIAILNTHKHWDHTCGNLDLYKKYPNVRVYGSEIDFQAGINNIYNKITNKVKDGDEIEVGRCSIKVISTPCHTKGSVMFLVDPVNSLRLAGMYDQIEKLELTASNWNPLAPLLFTGDTLFLGGCGRFFEGNATDMYKIVHKLTKILATNTYIFPGHEYTFDNLAFAKLLDPSSVAIELAYNHARDCKRLNFPTVPGDWGQELQTNPYLLVDCKGKDLALWKYTMKRAEKAGIVEGIRKLVVETLPKDAPEYAIQEMVMIGCIRTLKDSFVNPNK
ncbi:hypothetical protein HDV04_000260 [Boothiomyces sp. JEL0838]|nr:hypothetical protein HDV04_000260 [Boothiomyces sp. JEL0838]